MEGWIKLHRSMLDWEWYDDQNCFRVFMHLLIIANHKDNKWRGRLIKRGQHLTSLGKLASGTGLTVSKVRTAIQKLESTGEIASHGGVQDTVFTIKNYDLYQGDDTALTQLSQANDTAIASQSQANDKPLATNKNDNNDLEGKELENENRSSILPAKAVNSCKSEVVEIFEYWKKAMGKDESTKLIKKRESAVKARLKEGYTVDQVKKAIYGCSLSPFNMGQNSNGKAYNDLELICRDGVKLEGYAENADRPPIQSQPKQRGEHQPGWSQELLNGGEIL